MGKRLRVAWGMEKVRSQAEQVKDLSPLELADIHTSKAIYAGLPILFTDDELGGPAIIKTEGDLNSAVLTGKSGWDAEAALDTAA